MKLTITLILVFFTLNLSGQRIEFIRADLDNLKGAFNIEYRLDDKTKRSRYKVDLGYRENSDTTFTYGLMGVSGDIGYNVKPGLNHIEWTYFIDAPELTGKNLMFQLRASVDTEYKDNLVLSLGGPEKFYQSILVPGLGNYHVRNGKRYYLISALVYGLIGSGLYYHFRSDKIYNDYLNSTTPEEAESNFEKANNYKTTSRYLLGTGGTIWTIDIFQVIIKGTRNRKKQKEILKRRNQ